MPRGKAKEPSDEAPENESSSEDRQSTIANVVDKVRKEYGGVIGAADRMNLWPTIRRLSSGSFMLDYVMGGGLPEGRITMFKGPKSSGKTTHATRLIANAQRLCRRCLRPAKISDVVQSKDYWKAVGQCDCIAVGIVEPPPPEAKEKDREYESRLAALRENSYEEFIAAWIDMEMAFDWTWAKRLGIDTRRLIFSRPETGETAIDTIDPLLRTGGIDLVVIDSIAHFIPSVEVEESTYDQQQGAMARLVNKGVRKFVSAVAYCANTYGRCPTQIWINQERDKLGLHPGKVTPGGKGQGFATSVELDCWSQGRAVDKIQAGNKEDVIVVPKSVELHFRCTKNKTSSDGIEGFYEQILTDVDGKLGQINEKDQLYRFALHFGLLVKESDKGPYTYKLTGFTCKTGKEMKEHIDAGIDDLKRELMKILLLK